MIKTPINLQDLRRKIYVKAKAEKQWRFWGMYAHICKLETLQEAYKLAKQNNGAPGIDGVTFSDVEAVGLNKFLAEIQAELLSRNYRPIDSRKVKIPKADGKSFRELSIPSIKDRVVAGAIKLVLEPIFEADFQEGSFGYRPKRRASKAISRVTSALQRRMNTVIDLDISNFFGTVKHDIALAKIAKRIQDADVMWLIKLLLKSGGKKRANARRSPIAINQQYLS